MPSESDATTASPERVRRGLRLLTVALNAFADAVVDYPRLLDTVARNLADAIGDACMVLLRTEDALSLELAAIHDADPAVVADLRSLFAAPLPLDQPTMARDVMMSGIPMCVPSLDMQELARRTTPASLAVHQRIGTYALLIVPLRVRDEPIGALSIVRHGPPRPALDAFDVEIAHDLARHAALAISNARLLRRTQQELERRMAAEHAALFLDAIVENIPDMIFVKDAEKLAFTRLNRAGEELLGIPRAELLGKSDADFFPAEEAAFFQRKDRDTLHGKALVDIPEEPIETRGGPRWLHTKKVPILDASGAPLYLLGISHDITERKHADAALREAKDATDVANRELEAFSYSVAHDLRAPLRAIHGFSSALVEDLGPKLAGEDRVNVDRILTAAEHMGRLIDALLALARLSRTEVHREPVDLSAIARSIEGQLRAVDPGRAVDLAVGEGLVARGDPRLLRVLLENLLGNAWKFTKRRPRATIAFGGERPDGAPCYYVKDDGAGFDMQWASQLFSPFRRLHKDSDFEGTGIGLATVQRIVVMHGGKVWADASPGAGATFRFTLGES